MGAVWRAVDLHLGAPVAIKLIHQRDVNNTEMLARFEAEAEIAAQLRSPHVVQVFDAGVDRASGMPFIAMELLEGESLRDRLARSGPLAPAQLMEILSQVSRALTRAHERGIIHRDLKPANIFLLRDGDREVVKVLDFGIAKRTHGLRASPTVTGDLLGTPTYMSPEQILSSKEVSYRTDLWSMAVIAAECLTGKLPFDCDNLPGLALMICHGQSTPPSQLGTVPEGFDAWFQKATQLSPAERFVSATAMVEELRHVCGGQRQALQGPIVDRKEEDVLTRSDGVGQRGSPSVGPTTTTVPRQVSPLRRQRRRRVAALLAAGALLLVATCTVLRGRDGEPTIAAAPSGEPLQSPDTSVPERITAPNPQPADPIDVSGAGGSRSVDERVMDATRTEGQGVPALTPPPKPASRAVNRRRAPAPPKAAPEDELGNPGF